MPASLVYVYCLVKSRQPPSVADAPRGLPGAKPARAINAGGELWIVAADAPARRYSAEAVEASFDDLKWVGRCAMAHEAVVEHFANAKAVVPITLFTIFQSESRALDEIGSARAGIDEAVERLAGAAEWGVRLTRRERRVAPRQGALKPATGTSFLQQKRQIRDDRLAATVRGHETADALFADLSLLAREGRRRDAQTLAAGPGVLLDAAFLVARKDAILQTGDRQEGARGCGGCAGSDDDRTVAAVQLRRGTSGADDEAADAREDCSIHTFRAFRYGAHATPMSARQSPRDGIAAAAPIASEIIDQADASLLDVIDNLLNQGVVVNGELILSIASVDLIYLQLSLLLCAADRVLAPDPDAQRAVQRRRTMRKRL